MTFIGENEETKKIVVRMLTELLRMLEDSREDIGRFQGLDWRRTFMGLMSANLLENGTKLLRAWLSILLKADNPVFRATSAFEKGEMKMNGQGVKSIHFNGSDDTIELLLQTITSVNQLSVYGAVSDLCGELARDSRGTGKPAATGNLDSMGIPT